MGSSFSGNPWQTTATDETFFLNTLPAKLSKRVGRTYELDLMTFHAFFNLITSYVVDFPAIPREPGLSKALGNVTGKGEVVRATGSSIKKRTLVAFRGASKTTEHDIRPFITELLVLLHPYLRQEPHIVNLVGFEWEASEPLNRIDYATEIWPVLKIEFGDHETIDNFLESKVLEDTLHLRRSLCQHIGTGLKALHKCHIVHGDLKPKNIVIFRADTELGFVAKLCDFDLSLIVNLLDKNPVKLPGHSEPWTAPEGKTLKVASDFFLSDVYSFGLIVWSCFTVDQEYFEPRSIQAGAGIMILKAQDKVLNTAYSSIRSTLLSLKPGRNTREELETFCNDLLEVFKNTLTFDPQLRSLNNAVAYLSSYQPTPLSLCSENFSSVSPEWPPIYYFPLRMMAQDTILKNLHGNNYYEIPGSRAVAKASVSTCEHVFSRPEYESFMLRSDAAAFLFRCHLEGYGVPMLSNSHETALRWLSKALDVEIENKEQPAPWLMEVDLIYERLGFSMPLKTGLKELIQRAIMIHLSEPYYSQWAIKRVCNKHRIDFEQIFEHFRDQGLFALGLFDEEITALFKGKKSCQQILQTLDPKERLSRNGYTMVHLAASCGNLDILNLLYRRYQADLNVMDDMGITPIWLAIHYSHANVVEWLIHQNVPANSLFLRGGSSFAILPRFRDDEHTKVAAALSLGGCDINDSIAITNASYTLQILSWAAVFTHPNIVQIILDQEPSDVSCAYAMGWAASVCQLENFLLIESHRRNHFQYARTRTEMANYLRLAVTQPPFARLCNSSKPSFRQCVELFCSETGNISKELLLTWATYAIQGGDFESFEIILSHTGIEQLKDRMPLPEDANNGLRGLVEHALMFDRRDIFDLLISRGFGVTVNSIDKLYPTLFHTAAHRELNNGRYFCGVLASHGEDIKKRCGERNGHVSALEIALVYGNLDVADFLIQSGAPLDFETGPENSILGEMIMSMTEEAVPNIEFVLSHPQSSPRFVVHAASKTTLLHRAAGPLFPANKSWQNDASMIRGPQAILEILLKHYADPVYLNVRDSIGCTPLHTAAYRGFDAGVRLLLEAGADPYLLNCQGMNPVLYTMPTFFMDRLENTAFFYEGFDNNIQSYAIVSRTGRNLCRELLTDCSGNPMLTEVGFMQRFLAFFGFIDLTKGDDEDYEPWELEKSPHISKYFVSRRKVWHARRLQQEKRARLEEPKAGKDRATAMKEPSPSLIRVLMAAIQIWIYSHVFPEVRRLDGVPESRLIEYKTDNAPVLDDLDGENEIEADHC